MAGVSKILSEVQEHKASRPDGFPPGVLRQCAESVAPMIYQASIDTGGLTSDWRTAHITLGPVFMKGNSCCPTKLNYRPVP